MEFNLKDIFTITLNPLQVVVTLVLAFVAGLYVFFIYKKTFGGVMYSRNFNLSLIMMTMVTSLMLMTINNSLAVSMGMVGALSIIRFRTAVKDTIDTVFIFWAMGEGIAIGTRLYDVALISALTIGLILVLVNLVKGKNSMPYLLVLHYDESASGPVRSMIKQLPGARLKSKSVQRDGVEMTVEVRLRDNETGFVDKFMRVEGVYEATLISHQGDIVG